MYLRLAGSVLISRHACCLQVCETPLAVLGLLRLLRSVLGNPIQYADDRFVMCQPAILQLITTCASGQPGLMQEVSEGVRVHLYGIVVLDVNKCANHH